MPAKRTYVGLTLLFWELWPSSTWVLSKIAQSSILTNVQHHTILHSLLHTVGLSLFLFSFYCCTHGVARNKDNRRLLQSPCWAKNCKILLVGRDSLAHCLNHKLLKHPLVSWNPSENIFIGMSSDPHCQVKSLQVTLAHHTLSVSPCQSYQSRPEEDWKKMRR